MKAEIDYVVEKHVNNGMKILKVYRDRKLMLTENPNVNKENFIIIEGVDYISRYNEINGNKMKWE